MAVVMVAGRRRRALCPSSGSARQRQRQRQRLWIGYYWLHAELGAKHQSEAMLATFLKPHCIQNIAYIS